MKLPRSTRPQLSNNTIINKKDNLKSSSTFCCSLFLIWLIRICFLQHISKPNGFYLKRKQRFRGDIIRFSSKSFVYFPVRFLKIVNIAYKIFECSYKTNNNAFLRIKIYNGIKQCFFLSHICSKLSDYERVWISLNKTIVVLIKTNLLCCQIGIILLFT